MKSQFIQRLRWWILASIFSVVGLLIALAFIPRVREIAKSSLAALKIAHPDGDGHDHAKGATDAHDDGEAGHDHSQHAEGSGEAGHDHSKHADGDDEDEDEHEHAHKEYDHKHDEAGALKLSEQARGNIGLQLTKVELRNFSRTTAVPGIVVERPGWSVMEVTAPMTGIVTRIYPIQGEAVEPGQPLFDVRLTHEDLLQAQTEFLRTIEELDVIGREVARLEKVSADGAIAGKTVLERKYEQQKQQGVQRAQRQALLLHGLTDEQVDGIVANRTLLQSLTIHAPAKEGGGSPQEHPLRVQELKVTQGKYVTAGDTLCTLADHGELYIEGQAFEQDMQTITRAVAAGEEISAVLGQKSTADEEIVPGLHILYLDDKVDRDSRAFHFYVPLPNRLVREDKTPDGRRLIYWQYRPGQRLQVRIPVEQWKDRVVLPVEAVAQDGAEAYVFEANDDHFDRRPVHVEYRDQDWVVIANDGALQVGTMVAASAAHQMQLALKNKAGGGVDPHAGHNH